MKPPGLQSRRALAGYAFLEAYPDPVAIHRGGTLLYANRAGLALVGATSDEQVLGRNVLEFVHPDSQAAVIERLKRTAAGERADLLGERFLTLAGDALEVEVVALPINLEDGPATQLIIRDVSELRRVERENARLALEVERAAAGHQFTQEALELAETAAGLGVWDWQVGTEQLRWTKGLEPLHGLEPGTFRGTFEHFIEAVYEEDRPALLAAIETALQSPQKDGFEARFRVLARGEPRWIMGKGRVLRDASGTPVRMVGIGLDVTERTRVELALAEQEALLRLVTGLLPANVAYFDPEERYRFVNDTYRSWFRVEPGEVIGMTAREFMGKKAYEQCAPALRQAFAGEPAGLEMDILNLDGGRRFLSARYVPDLAPDGTVRGVVALVNDVTALHETNERLQAALAAREDFIGFTTHELKTPLTVILGFADVLARRASELETETVADISRLLHQEARRLEEIIENMLQLARADTTTADEPALLHRCAEKVFNSRRWRIEERPREFRVAGQPRLVIAASGWLEHVIENLLSNAEKYSDPETAIELEVADEGSSVRVSVLDRGRGVSEDQAASLFEPFFRANPMEPGVPGIGLGLTVCRKLVARLGGEIWLRPRPGGGAEAGFRIPSATGQLE